MEIPVSTMTTAEKLLAMEQLWTSLQGQPDHVLPDWHESVLLKRRQRIERGETTFSTLDEVCQRIKSERNC